MTANIAAATDAQLIQRSRNGDESAFGEIVERYQSLACSVAYSRCGDLAISEDCAQEAFLQAWCKLADLKDVTKFKSWLCTIVRNLATRSHKQSARNVSSMAASLGTVAEPTSADIDPAERVVTAEEEQLVWQALAAIPENYREPMILFYREGQSVAKVAEALEISPDAVKQRLSRGRKFLQEQLAATVQSTLEKSKPAQGFTSAVIMGITGAKTKAATAGIVTSSAAKSVLGGSGFGGLIFISLAQLPLMAWLYKSAWAETRSSRERQLMVRFLIFWMLALIPLAALAFLSSGWKNSIESPTLRAMILPGLMVLYCTPMIISGRRLGKRVEQLRKEESTDTPLRSITNHKHGSTRWLFIGSALLVISWSIPMPVFAGDWASVLVLISSATVIGFLGSLVPSNSPKTSFRAYGITLGAVALVGIGVMSWQQTAWYAEFSDSADTPYKLVGATDQPMKNYVRPVQVLRQPNSPLGSPPNTTRTTPHGVATKLYPPLAARSPTVSSRTTPRASFWWLILMQAMPMTNVILTMIAWKRVYGKQQD